MPEQRRYIRFLKSTAYNSRGDAALLREETENEVYYYDSMERWCYLDKVNDADTFETINDPYAGEDPDADDLARKIIQYYQDETGGKIHFGKMRRAARHLLDTYVEISERE